ncbi:hypothetical protein G4H71_09695 [Rhodococcus triatomae]|uniref:Uncharacterized protein n=1 Tax=Rhodococcus triatomae TaxID=300028 RepID=A0A1G8SR59_9NOCA|nr:hypothetical protein [Rhodococcus triatomae]QNG20816.1 hypothetical protein G4H72_20690 [Rhodococcus triatomae]QNG23269.1 hypothetical protein G4H71_09695 [Rhodococcus triatomae]SDJ31623.1 hypothetical protein SAMN05444695_12323 [Rhodococcus triatomae]
MKFSRLAAAATVATGAGAAVLLSGGTAAAATPSVDLDKGYAGVLLDRNETAIASQIDAGVLINLAVGDNWIVNLPDDSIWNTGGWTPVTGDQLFDEAAANNGVVGVWVTDPARYRAPLYVQSLW